MEHPHLPPPGTVAWQLLIVFGLVLANAFFVAAEFSLVSVRRTRIDQLAAENHHTAKVVQSALRDLDRYIAATQVGITIASLMLGGVGERTLEPLFSEFLRLVQVPAVVLGVTRATVAFGLAYFIMTAMHVIIGELMPKSIALQMPEKSSLVIAQPMRFFARLFAPLIWLLNGTGNFLLRRLGFHAGDGHSTVHSPEELDLIFSQSHAGGELNATEFEILRRVVHFSDVNAREVMVPRVDMQTLPVQISPRQLTAFVSGSPHVRVPVVGASLDDIQGVAHLKDLVRLETSQRDSSPDYEIAHDLAALGFIRPVCHVPESITIDKLLVKLRDERQQMAILMDEYGGTAGLITMGDLLEQVFGEVHDEFDTEAAVFEPLPDGSVRMAGRLRITEVNEKYHAEFPAEEADTMAGLVLDALGRPARPGDEVMVQGYRLRVLEVDRLRIIRLLMVAPARDGDANGESKG